MKLNSQVKLLSFTLCFVGIFSVGCGGNGVKNPDMGTVSGKVTLDGTSLVGVMVSFEPSGTTPGHPSMAKTDSDGRYTLDYDENVKGAVVGTHDVRITTPQEAPDPTGKFKDPVPKKYNTNTELHQEVKPGANQIDFELTTK